MRRAFIDIFTVGAIANEPRITSAHKRALRVFASGVDVASVLVEHAFVALGANSSCPDVSIDAGTLKTAFCVHALCVWITSGES